MNCPTEELGEALVVYVDVDTIDASNAKALKQQIDPLILGRSSVALGMNDVQFIDSSGLGTLLTFMRKIKSAGGALVLFGLSDQARSLFELVKMDRIFEIVDTKADAIRSLEGDD